MQRQEWLTSTLEEGEHVWLLRVMDGQELRGWRAATTSGLVDALNEQAYASAADNDPEVFAVYRLTPGHPVPVRVKSVRGQDFTEVTLSWRCPAENRTLTETVFTRIYGA